MENENTQFRELDWLSIVLAFEKQYYKDDVAYEFSNGRKFKSTDRTNSGVYDGS